MPNYRFSGYQYETSPRKLEPEYTPKKNPYAKKKSSILKKKSNVEKTQKSEFRLRARTVMYIGIVFSILFAISYRNSLINESFNNNANLKSTLATIQKENEQLQVNIENNLNLSNIEKIAEEKLGMKKLDATQKVYVSLPKKDYVEPAGEEIVIEENEVSWFENIINFFANL